LTLKELRIKAHGSISVVTGSIVSHDGGLVGDVTPALEIAAGIMGGGLATVSHATKAGTRLAVNTSLEPFSNWGLSIAEDVAVIGGLWTAVTHPVVFIGLLIVFILLAIWLLPRIWAGAKFIVRKLGLLFGLIDEEPKFESGLVTQLEKLKKLHDTGAISDGEYEKLKTKLIDR
jgi:hypothetical protein